MTSHTPLDELKQTLEQGIPVSQQMGVQIVHYDGHSLELSAPLATNLNDKSTAFAGSLYSVCTLTGWSLLSLKLKEAGFKADVAIYASETKYFKPVTQDIQTLCTLPETKDVENFIDAFRNTGKSKIELNVEIRQDDKVSVVFAGSYVALRKN